MALAANIESIEQFLAHALAIEREAAARYLQFADQMLTHGNPEAAATFERLAHEETAHHERLQQRARARPPGALKPWEYRWIDPESPEAAPLDEVHYLMSPWHALRIAQANEERAQQFYEAVARSENCPPEVRALAVAFGEEEKGHALLIAERLAATPRPRGDRHRDRDPPVAVD